MYTYIFQIYTGVRNWEFIGVIFLLAHNIVSASLGHPQVKHNYITYIYLENAIDITTDPLFHNLSLIIYLYKGKWAIYFKMNWL
jgi:hypothetical protein